MKCFGAFLTDKIWSLCAYKHMSAVKIRMGIERNTFNICSGKRSRVQFNIKFLFNELQFSTVNIYKNKIEIKSFNL